MEDLILFRLFLAFPFIGLLLPDMVLIFPGLKRAHIPGTHIVVETTLLTCMLICTLGIWYFEHKTGTLISRAEEDDTLLSA